MSHLCSGNEQRQLGDRPVSLSPFPVSLLRGRAGGPRVTGMPEMFYTLTGRPYLASPPTHTGRATHKYTQGQMQRYSTQDLHAWVLHIRAHCSCSHVFTHLRTCTKWRTHREAYTQTLTRFNSSSTWLVTGAAATATADRWNFHNYLLQLPSSPSR